MTEELRHDYDPGFAPLLLAEAHENLRLFRLASRKSAQEARQSRGEGIAPSAVIERLAFERVCRENGVYPHCPLARQELERKLSAKGLDADRVVKLVAIDLEMRAGEAARIQALAAFWHNHSIMMHEFSHGPVDLFPRERAG